MSSIERASFKRRARSTRAYFRPRRYPATCGGNPRNERARTNGQKRAGAPRDAGYLPALLNDLATAAPPPNASIACLEVISRWEKPLRLGHDREHALHQGGVAIGAAWP